MQKLSKEQSEILACVCLDADQSAKEIADKTGVPVHRVQYQITRLVNHGIISWTPIIDIHMMGYSYFGVFFSVAGAEKQWRKLLAILSKDQRIGWVSEFAGEFQFGIAILERSATNASNVFFEILDKAGVRLIKKSVAIRTNVMDFPRRDLSKNSYHRVRIISGPACRHEPLPKEDLMLLQALALQPFTSYRDLARKLSMAHTSLDARLKRLRELGVLLSPVYTINAASIGKQAFKLLLFCPKANPKDRIALTHAAPNFNGSHHFVECFGEWDFELNVDLDDREELSLLVRDIYGKFDSFVEDIKPLALLKMHKRFHVPMALQGKS